MQAEKQMPVRWMGRIFLALCIILFMGCTTQVRKVFISILKESYKRGALRLFYEGEYNMVRREATRIKAGHLPSKNMPHTTGVPVQTGKYTRVRCRPDAFSSKCLEEQTVIPDGAANVVLPLKADPVLMKTFQDDPDISALSEDTYGSGNEMELESGSGTDDSVEGFIAPHFALHQSDRDLGLRLTGEGLFPQNQLL